MRSPAVSVLAVALIAGIGLGGYALGHARAPGSDDARKEQRSARHLASTASQKAAESSSRDSGSQAGRTAGLRAGARQGGERGSQAGAQRVEDQQLALAEAEQLERQRAAEAEEAERARNCGAPLFAPGACPTDEEIESEGLAESLCGGGNYEEARAQGIACFPPGDLRNP